MQYYDNYWYFAFCFDFFWILFCFMFNNFFVKIFNYKFFIYFFNVTKFLSPILVVLLYKLNQNSITNSIVIQIIFLDYICFKYYLNEIFKITPRKYDLILISLHYHIFYFKKNQNFINDIQIISYWIVHTLIIISKYYKLSKYIWILYDISFTIINIIAIVTNNYSTYWIFRFSSSLLIFEKTKSKNINHRFIVIILILTYLINKLINNKRNYCCFKRTIFFYSYLAAGKTLKQEIQGFPAT